MKKAILLILLIFFISVSFVSASDNTTEIQKLDDSEITNISLTVSSQPLTNSKPIMYVNSTKEVSGNGNSWENASNSISLKDNADIFLAEGEYEIPGEHMNVTYIGLGKDTIITSFSFKQSYYFNTNHTVTVINATFKPYSQVCGILQNGVPVNVPYNVLVDEMDFKFINCTFINSEFLSRTYERSTPNRDTLTDVVAASFENCTFKNFNGKYLFNNWDFSKFNFNKCTFENITADAIVDSYGGHIDSQGRVDGVYIYNSIFNNCNVTGIVKARQLSYCEIAGCTYDFDASETADLVSPFYVNKTIKATDLNETKLTVTTKDNSVIITLTDINTNKPIAGVEVAIINNDKVFAYRETDSTGQIVLDNLLGTYNFEFSYPGDEYVGYAPTSLNKTFTFTKNQTSDSQSNPEKTPDTPTNKKTVKKTSKITAKKVTFKKSKKVKKYTITLKSGKNPIKKVKVTLKVKGKTYKATTNAKGKATFKITKLTKKGTFTAKISFKGNALYKAVSKSIKIKVK